MQITNLLDSCALLFRSYAKINLFLKIVGQTCINNVRYHLLQTRFLRVDSLYDTLGLSFDAEKFEILGDFECSLQQNLIYKAYQALLPHITESKRKDLSHIRVVVEKKIPSGGGLGGGSSNAAYFLKNINTALHLGLTLESLMEIGAQLGSDINFFLSDLKVANAEGRGEIITPCEKKDSEPFAVEIFKPEISCQTSKVFQKYADDFYSAEESRKTKAQEWLEMSNVEILSHTPKENNDLLKPVLALYPSLNPYYQDGAFLSGSGSCFWKKIPA